MERGIGLEESLELFGHRRDILFGVDPVDAAVEAPDEFARADPLGNEHADAGDRARPQLGFDQHHDPTPLSILRATNVAQKRCGDHSLSATATSGCWTAKLSLPARLA